MSENVSEIQVSSEEKLDFEVKITRTHYGYVKVRARNKDEARSAVEQMDQRKMLTYYKEQFEFVTVCEATELA